jgi:site-specific DNA-methyltransferase (adenine-specific)
LRGRNPDVLTCIANLSNDEVFTPPELANRMLETLAKAWAADNGGADIWADKTVRFLDPCTKSGVFLREIASRLTKGLTSQIPNLDDRVNHILTKQVFGIGITYLTSMLARRSVYCSKHAQGKHSIAKGFASDAGNIWFERTEHKWAVDGKCTYCGATQKALDRGGGFETHAYAFIHTSDIQAQVAGFFGGDMQFDVIIGNPPYQLETGGSGRQATPIYNKFVQQAMELDPRYLVMVIQSRWFGGGMGLAQFRSDMLGDRRIRKIVDFTNSNDVFSGTDFGGGVCYFLWNRDEEGPCEVENHHAGEVYRSERYLDEFEFFIRFAPAVPILKKVLAREEPSIKEFVSPVRPFGIPTSARPGKNGSLTLVSSGGRGPIERKSVTAGVDRIDSWKVMTSKTSHDHAGLPDKDGARRVLSRLEVLPPRTVCTESYIVVWGLDTEARALNCAKYLSTRFTRFLISLLSYSQDITSERFHYVPVQDFSKGWTDADLYKKYGLTKDQIAFVERMIRPMDLGSGDTDRG